jgi:uncharacterized repeat protein (TIGR03833 family)
MITTEKDNNPAHFRTNIALHAPVEVVLKKDQKTGKLTKGFVRWILTSKPYHSRGIKVMLETRQVGRVQNLEWAAPKNQDTD